MSTLNQNLQLTSLTHSQHLGTCGYWYVIRADGLPHTAFATKTGVLQWAMERGLIIAQFLPEPGQHGDMASGTWSTQRIVGAYREKAHMNAEEFDAVQAQYAPGTPYEHDDRIWTASWALAREMIQKRFPAV